MHMLNATHLGNFVGFKKQRGAAVQWASKLKDPVDNRVLVSMHFAKTI